MVCDDAVRGLVFWEVEEDESHRTCHLLLRCWGMETVPCLPALVKAVGIPGSIRSATRVAKAKIDPAVGVQTFLS